MLEEGAEEDILLQFADGYVMQTTSDKAKVISAFRCHYDMQF
jgi:hypothetical protein